MIISISHLYSPFLRMTKVMENNLDGIISIEFVNTIYMSKSQNIESLHLKLLIIFSHGTPNITTSHQDLFENKNLR